ncbi:MAG: glycogen synthase [Nonlabens sp.]
MKVLFYTKEFPPEVYGGAGVHAEYLAANLKKYVEVEVRSFGKQETREEQLNVQGYRSNQEIVDGAPDQLKGLLQTLLTNVRMNIAPVDASIVHCHTWYSNFAGILAKLCYGTPLIVTTHSLEPLRPWKREQLGRGYDASSWIEKTAIEMADGIIAVSEETREDVLNNFDVDSSKVNVIYNGIDLKHYVKKKRTATLEEYGIEPDKPFVLFVGRITRQKGIIHLVNAIKHIDAGTQVVLCAGAPDTAAIGKEMETAVNEIKKDRDNVIWIAEMLEKEQVIELYSHATVFCCPSIYEPFGIINIEAMACECPVVASAVGGIKEVVIPGETGILIPLEQQNEAPFEPVDPEQFARDLASGINQITANPAQADKMGAAGRKRVEDHFDWDAIALQTKELYNTVIEKYHG